ncbi:unnamed protein product [Owenia fusiformis]|uniref:RHD domain-containing protein n=1 Tax=Owenia fusiformis TaxID=6347 RepID=A0A8S4PNE7_OWEFU|nr:unnamed protein product [Owenia fusiformis]
MADSSQSDDSMELGNVNFDQIQDGDTVTVEEVGPSEIVHNVGAPIIMQNGMVEDDGTPYLHIIEEPQQRGFRFRYRSENSASHGGLQGCNSKKSHKSYPTVELRNYQGTARIVVSLVTDETVPKTHAHELVGKNCNNGICVVQLDGRKNMTATFPNLGIIHVTKKKVVDTILSRVREDIKLQHCVKNNVPPEQYRISSDEEKMAKKEAEKQAKDMQLNVVRLCFQAYLPDDNGSFTLMLPSVVSLPIYDSKSTSAAGLKICRMSKQSGVCLGGDEVFLLCDKVQKNDIEVYFYEEDEDGAVTWRVKASFSQADVHRQYAIVFKTPPYWQKNIPAAKNVQLQLQRISDGERSEPKPFTYIPEPLDKEEIKKKKQKTFPGGDFSSPGGGSFGGGFGGSDFQGSGASGSGGGFSNLKRTYDSTQQGGGQQTFTTLNPVNIQQISSNTYIPVHQTKTATPVAIKPQNQTRNLRHEEASRRTIPTYSTMSDLPRNVEKDAASVIGDYSKSKIGCPRLHPNDESGYDDVDCTIDQSVLQSRGMSVHQPLKSPLRIHDENTESGYHSQKFSSSEELLEKTKDEGSWRGSSKQEDVTIKLTEMPANGEHVESGAATVEYTEDNVSAKFQEAKCVMRQDSRLEVANKLIFGLHGFATTGDSFYILLILRHLLAAEDDNGDNCLHLPVIHKQLDALRNIVRAILTLPDRKMVNHTNHLRQTPSHLAVITGNSEALEMLLQLQPDITAVDRNGNTAVHMAANNGDDRCLEVLLKYFAERYLEDDYAVLETLNYDGYAPIHLAVKSRSLTCVKLLAIPECNVNIRDGTSGNTALHLAVELDRLSIAGFLTQKGKVDINVARYDGNTPLHLAVSLQNVAMTALLIAGGADPSQENSEPINESSSGSDEEEEKICHTSLDLAKENTKILLLLTGGSLNETPPDSDGHDGLVDSGLSMGITGNMSKLDLGSQLELSVLLNKERKGQDWRRLAELLQCETVVPSLKEMPNPTKSLFDYYQSQEGTIETLRECLWLMSRYDTLKILDRFITHQPKGQDDETCDSGLEVSLKSMVIK